MTQGNIYRFIPDKMFLIPILLLSGFLLFYNINNYYIGQDEGDYPTHALNILKHGVPKIDKYFFDPMFTLNGIWAYHPWLGMYLTALSISILGKTTLAAKLFPILSGFLAIFPLYQLAYRLSERSREVARLTVVFFVLSVPCILFSRTTRYYPYALLFVSLVSNSYLDLIEEKKNSGIKFSFGSILFFYASFTQFFGVMLGLGIHFLIFHLKNRSLILKFFTTALIIAVFTLPWFFYFPFQIKTNWAIHNTAYIGTPIENIKNLSQATRIIVGNLAVTNSYVFPLILLFFLKRFFFGQSGEKRSSNIHIVPLIIFGILLASTLQNSAALDYVAGIIPLFFILLALVCLEIKRRFKAPTTLVIVTILLTTNFIHSTPWYAIKIFDQVFSIKERFPPESYISNSVIRRSVASTRPRFVLIDYLQEITHDFDSSLKPITNYINNHKKPSDTFLAAHEEMEIAYYIGLKPAVDFPFKITPNWIIPRGNYKFNPYHKLEPREVRLERHHKILEYIENNSYKKIEFNSIDIGIENSGYIENHFFKKPKTGDPVVIYHKETDS